MVISTVPSRGDVQNLHADFIHPEEKTVRMVDKVIVTTLSFVHVEDYLRELVQGNTVCLHCLFDEFHGEINNFLFFCGVTDVVLCEYMLGNGPQWGCNACEKGTY